jgi:hypothetical protein
MSRTHRNVPDWKFPPNEYATAFQRCYRVENRKARDGSGNHWVCQSATEGKLNNWHDGGRGYGKRMANKEIRNFYKVDLRKRVAEYLEGAVQDAEELREQLAREDDWIYDDRWDDWLEEQRWNEREAQCEEDYQNELENEYRKSFSGYDDWKDYDCFYMG